MDSQSHDLFGRAHHFELTYDWLPWVTAVHRQSRDVQERAKKNKIKEEKKGKGGSERKGSPQGETKCDPQSVFGENPRY